MEVLFGTPTTGITKGGESVSKSKLWPLNILMTFNDKDHFKNGEGLKSNHDDDNGDNTLKCRVRRLVSERTGGKCNPSPDQKIFILTHLSYYGYCFNPVSFYYIMKEAQQDHDNNDVIEEENIEAIVAEVSNTPWNEMKCYVLHPHSSDMETVKEGRTRKSNEKIQQDNDHDNEQKCASTSENIHNVEKKKNDWKSINYIFEKKFHVSPFMEMDYMYDWTFWQLKNDRIIVNTCMMREKQDAKPKNTQNGIKCFSAAFDITRSPFNPFSLCYQLVKFPIYCFIIQIWIHVEALKLFSKGVEFIPHPQGSETKASLIIGAMMEPFFKFKDWFRSKGEKDEELKPKSE